MGRITVIVAIVIALIPSPTAADLSGTRKMNRHNAYCGRVGTVLERHGLSERERAWLDRKGCRKENGQWVSGLVFTA